MNRTALLPLLVALPLALLTTAAQADDTGAARPGPVWGALLVAQMSAEERRALRERWEQMSPEERARLRRDVQERMPPMRPDGGMGAGFGAGFGGGFGTGFEGRGYETHGEDDRAPDRRDRGRR